MKKILILFFTLLLLSFQIEAQVKTNFNNSEKLTKRGQFDKSYSDFSFEITPPNLENALRRDKTEDSLGSKVFYIAEPVAVNINVSKLANWVEDEKFSYGKFTLFANGAKTLSINFTNFFLPKGTEMFIYNRDAEMITGVITEAENNENKIWGSSIYKGDMLNIEVKLPKTEKGKLSLFITNVAYGYKDVFINKIAGFGQSGACNINVLCPLGNGWEPERNSVVYIARSNGDALCSGAMLMNTCATNIPYVLTADHCFQGDGNVAGWKVHFQAWSSTCSPSQNSDGILFNGSTLRANWQPSDFCLVQLNQTPPANSGIHYAGWSRQNNAATSGVGMHHPSGDVMKISNYTTPLVREDDPTRCGVNAVGQLHWVVQWNQGVTEGGSSGSPLFDQNHRVVGQLSGGPSSCSQPANCRLDMYGRFDNSWTGGGTNATRLSNWLDPTNTGLVTTNTTNISALSNPNVNLNLSITGNWYVCTNSSSTYTLNGSPAGTTIVWSISNPTIASLAVNGNQATVSYLANGNITLTATVVSGGCVTYTNNVASRFLELGQQTITNIIGLNPPLGVSPGELLELSVDAITGTSVQWSVFGGTILGSSTQSNVTIQADLCPPGINNGYISVSCDFTHVCGSGTYGEGTTIDCGTGGGMYKVSPNPAETYITIDGQLKNKFIKEIRITDKIGNLKKEIHYSANDKKVTVNISNLPADIYFIQIFDGKVWERKQISIRR